MSLKKKVLLGIIIPGIVIILWWLVTAEKLIPDSLLPTLQSVKDAFLDMGATGQLQSDLLVSLKRVVQGFLLAAVFGIFLGTIMGMSKTVNAMLLPLVTTIRQIPMIAWFPLIILWCGIGELSKVVVIVIAAFFPVLVNTLNGIQSTPDSYIEVAELYKLTKWERFIKLYMPHALPHILVGVKLGLGVSWMAVVAAELVAATSGIGFRMNDARSMMRSDQVIVCMILIGLVGVIMDKLVSVLFGALTPWEKIQNKK